VRHSTLLADGDVQQHLKAVDIDLRCSLAFSRAVLQGLAAISAQARHALDAALDEELCAIAFDDADSSTAAHQIVSEARAKLHTPMPFQDRLARDLERAIIEKAAALEDVTRLREASRPEQNPPLRSCG
jgi:hypothetical protein